MTKDIIRFKKNGKKYLIMGNVTLEQAKEWCSSLFTRKLNNYFDGFSNHGVYCSNLKAKYSHYFTPNKEYN